MARFRSNSIEYPRHTCTARGVTFSRSLLSQAIDKEPREQPLRDHRSNAKGTGDANANINRSTYSSHVYYEDGDQKKKWLFCLAGDTRIAYCSKWLPSKKTPGRSVAPSNVNGVSCRRPWGTGPGFCNATKQDCCAPVWCSCVLNVLCSCVLLTIGTCCSVSQLTCMRPPSCKCGANALADGYVGHPDLVPCKCVWSVDVEKAMQAAWNAKQAAEKQHLLAQRRAAEARRSE